MLFFGHIAASLLIADASDSDRTAAVAGNLLPDVTDKTLAWVLHLTPSRWLAHGLPAFALINGLMYFILDRKRWRGFMFGYAGHLICDLWAGSKVPWFAPFQPKPPKSKFRNWRHRALYLAPDLIGLPIVWHLLKASRKA
jgi:hypothetical protein